MIGNLISASNKEEAGARRKAEASDYEIGLWGIDQLVAKTVSCRTNFGSTDINY